jgi:hypothetical protein
MNEAPQFKVGYDSILFDSGKHVKLDLPITKAIACASSVVVLLEVPTGSVLNENVMALDTNGQFLWQVLPRTYVYDDSPYTDIRCEGTVVKLTNWDGVNLFVDPTTGQVIGKDESR